MNDCYKGEDQKNAGLSFEESFSFLNQSKQKFLYFNFILKETNEMKIEIILFQGWFEMQINTKCSKIIWIVSKLQVGCLVRQVTFGGLTLAEQYLWLDGLSSLIWRGSNVITLSIPQYQYQPQIQNKKKNRRNEIFSDYGWPIFSAYLIISKLAEHMPSNVSNLDRLCSMGQLNRYF